jgi:large subunit ribosomal protein L5
VALKLKERYTKEVVPALMKTFDYSNTMQAPKLVKVVLNMGVGDAIQNPKALDAAADELGQITGQKPVITRAKKSIAAFKVRTGMAIGTKVTLRGDKMYYFVDKLLNIALPRVRDFRGLSTKGFDGRGNYSLGLKEQLIFPEIDYDKVEKIRGMDVVIVTTAKTDVEAKELLKLLGMPFRE